MNIKKLFSAVMVLMAFNACTFIPEPPYPLPITNGEVELGEGVYIKEAFSSTLGVFTSEQTEGNYPWVIDHSTAKATSYDSATGENNAATSWLISDPIDFTNETEAHASFEYIIRYSESGKIADNHKFLVSSDYNGDAAAATWVNLPYDAVEGADWDTFYKADVAIPNEFMGKNSIVVAFCYTATSKSSTWEVKNFKLEKGTSSNGSSEPIDAVEYTIPQAIEAFANGKEEYAIIKGYIVGAIDLSYTNCIFGTTTVKTNVLIAENADEKDKTKCIPVELPTGEILDKVNLKDNPDNYRREITFTGKITEFYTVAGLKDVREYQLGEKAEEPESDDFILPEGNNILVNGSFEEWNEEKPTGWGPENTKNPATIKQSNDAVDGNSSTVIEGVAGKNRLLYSNGYKLKAGTYNMVVYVKANGEEKGSYKLGYSEIISGAKIGTSVQYPNATASTVTDKWTAEIYEFTITEEKEISLVIMNNLNGKGASFLVDNVMLITVDGGIAE